MGAPENRMRPFLCAPGMEYTCESKIKSFFPAASN